MSFRSFFWGWLDRYLERKYPHKSRADIEAEVRREHELRGRRVALTVSGLPASFLDAEEPAADRRGNRHVRLCR